MYYFWLTVFPALVVFFGRFPATIRRIRVQRKELHPVEPIARYEHLPCIVNTIGVAFTEFFLLGLMALVVFTGLNAIFGTIGQAPDLGSGLRHLSLGTVAVIVTVGLIIAAVLSGGSFARYLLLFGVVFTIVTQMVMSSTGDQGPAIALFALIAAGLPTLFIALLRIFFD